MKSVSVVIPTFNSIRTIEACLSSLRRQDYDQDRIEILIADGGSTDGTIDVIKRHQGKIIRENSGNPETAKAIALEQAGGELVLLMASDNILPNRQWLKTMVNFLVKEPKALAAYPWRYAYRAQDSSLNRYFALMGANDPVAWWLNKADRQGYGPDRWQLAGSAVDKGEYFLVKFNKHHMPTLGDNGVLVWRKKLLQAKVDRQRFSHIDVFFDLIYLGMNQFVVVKNEIIHDTGEQYIKFLIKRFRYMRQLYLSQLDMRRFTWIKSRHDRVSLAMYVIYSLTLIGPTLRAVWGVRFKPDWAWFWHPIMCASMVIVYGLSLIIP